MATMDFSFDVGSKKQEITKDFCAYHGWMATIKGPDCSETPNPVWQSDFLRAKVAAYVKESINAFRVNKKRDEAARQEADATDAGIVLS
jgi:hypothetical protein